jgi:hypothetical protein
MSRWFRSTLAALVAVSIGLSSTACIGRMALTGKVMEFNLGVSQDRFARWIVFLILYIIPVYPFAGAIDLIIVNSIEFWSGTNPISGQDRLALFGNERRVVAEDGSSAISRLQPDGSIDIEVTDVDGSQHFLKLVREAGLVVARDADGVFLGAVGQDGRIVTAEASIGH